MKVYVASSWRNQRYPTVVAALRGAGFDVYDFRNPTAGDNGFSWSEIDLRHPEWTPAEYVLALTHPSAERGFAFDMAALRGCGALVLVLPCGRSAHLEAGWAAGAGKPTFILLEPDVHPEPELMYKMATVVSDNLALLITEMLREEVRRGTW